MATSNFAPMKYGMPLIVNRTYEQVKQEYEADFDEDLTENMYYVLLEDDAETAKEDAEEYSSTLTFHDVTVCSGYYEGFQFVVSERYENQFDMSKESCYCISNEEAHEYFDVCRSVALRKADAEKRKIEKWLLSLAANGYYNRLVCVARFSNGETFYNIV